MHGSLDREQVSEPRGPATESTALDARAVEVLSHELRSPITTIHLGTKVLRSSEIRAPVREAVLEAVDIEADRLLRVVEDLLAVVRHGAGARLRLEPVLLQRRLADLLGESRIDPGSRVRMYLPDDLPAVMADDAALTQIVRNLVINAQRHGTSEHPTELVGLAEPPGWVTLRVLDRGQGIAAADLPHLFEPFYRSRPSRVTGAGLGLAAAQRLTLAMGGTIWIEPRDGGGTMVAVRLRAAEPGD